MRINNSSKHRLLPFPMSTKFALPLVIGGALIFLVSVSFFVSNREQGSLPPEVLEPTQRIPELILQDYKGNQIVLVDFVGTPLVVNSWAKWCPFCKQELLDFAAVQEEFGDQITIIAIDRGESLETAKGFSDELGVSGDLIFLLDPNDSFYKAIGGFSMPETIFVNEEGFIVTHKRGPMDAEEVRSRARKLLNL